MSNFPFFKSGLRSLSVTIQSPIPVAKSFDFDGPRPIEKLISYASMSSQLKAGDIIMTGTMPGGCITEMPQEKPRWIQKNDEVLMQSPILGNLLNKVI